MAKTDGFILVVDNRLIKGKEKETCLYSDTGVQNLRKAGLLPLGTYIYHVDSLNLELPAFSEEEAKDIESLEEDVAKVK